MAKKREFVSDSEIEKFIEKKKNINTNPESSQSKLKFSIYPDKYLFDQVKTLAKIQDKDVNKMFLDLTQEAILKEEYQTAIQTFKKFF